MKKIQWTLKEVLTQEFDNKEHLNRNVIGDTLQRNCFPGFSVSGFGFGFDLLNPSVTILTWQRSQIIF